MQHLVSQSNLIVTNVDVDKITMNEGKETDKEVINKVSGSENESMWVATVVILAENISIASQLSQHGIQVQTLSETQPIQIHPARVLSQIFSHLGIRGISASCLSLLMSLFSLCYLQGPEFSTFCGIPHYGSAVSRFLGFCCCCCCCCFSSEVIYL